MELSKLQVNYFDDYDEEKDYKKKTKSKEKEHEAPEELNYMSEFEYQKLKNKNS